MPTLPSDPERKFAASPFGRRGEIIQPGGDGTTASPEAHMKANPPVTTVAVTVPVDLDLAENLIEVGRELPENMAAIHAQIAREIVAAHERSALRVVAQA